MSLTPIFFIAIFPAALLISGVIVSLVIKSDNGRDKIHLIISLCNLITSLIVIMLSILFPNQVIFINILYSPAQYFLMSIIFLFQVIFSIFIKYTSKDFPNSFLFDTFSFLIFLGLLGIISSINFLTLISFFILIIIMMGMIFYFGEFRREFNLLKNYFISCGISIISLMFAALILYIDTGTFELNSLGNIALSEIARNLLSILIILGLGVPCGLFPFYIFHLKKYFQESDYFHFVILMTFNYISTIIIMRLLNSIMNSNSISLFIILITSGIGVIIAIYYIILELYTSHDGFTYSIKKLIGYSLICDSNLILLLFANFYLFPEPIRNNLLNLLIFLYTSLIIIKLLLSYSFIVTANKSNEDNFRLLGNFWKENKIFGLLLFLSGLVLIFPVIFTFFYSLFLYYELIFSLLNSLVILISTITISLLIISLLIYLLFISHIFIQVYISTNVSYLERESSVKINKNLIISFSILLIASLLGYLFIYAFSPYWYLGLISF